MEKITVKSNDNRCILCAETTIDELHLGPMYRLDDVTCHYFCILFSSGLPQNGVNDEDGILGFLTSDIKKEVERANGFGIVFKCVFCKKKGAFVGCSIKACRKIWHFACGAKNGIKHQCFGDYEAFCAKDYKLPDKIKKYPNRRGKRCPICLVNFKPSDSPLFGSCCPTSVFHRDCVQKYALSSGSFFKCPTCSERGFKRDAEWQGVFVPEQDASWEQGPNAFRDLLRRRLRCDLDSCRCPQGRNFRDVDADGQWYIVRCFMCGGTCTHVRCGIVNDVTSWACDTCRPLALAQQHDDNDSDCIVTDDSSSDSDDLFEAIPPRKIPRKEN